MSLGLGNDFLGLIRTQVAKTDTRGEGELEEAKEHCMAQEGSAECRGNLRMG